MIKALLWKEWREQRSLVISGLALATILPLVVLAGGAALATGDSLRRLADVVPVLFAVFLWPLFALAAGASAFAGEERDRTSDFLLSRPVVESVVWILKVLAAAVTATTVIVGSFALERGIHWIADPPAAAEGALTMFSVSLGAPQRAVFGPATLYLVFAMAVFLSGRLPRALVAAIVALGMTFLFLAGALWAWPLTALAEHVREMWVAAVTVLAATLLLAASRRGFMRTEAGADVDVVATTANLGVVAALTLSLGLLPSIYLDTFSSLERADIATVAFDPAGESLVVEAVSYPSTQGSLWLLRDDGTQKRLTRRLAFAPFVSPDGRTVYYFSRRGFLGLARSTADMRAVGIDGSDDRLIAEIIDRAPRGYSPYRRAEISPALFSPSRGKVVLESWWGRQPMVVSLEEGGGARLLPRIEVASLPRRQWRQTELLGWLNESELLVRIFGSTLGGGTNTFVGYRALVRHDVVSGETVIISEGTRDTLWWEAVPDGYLASRSVPRRLPHVTYHGEYTAGPEGETYRPYAVLHVLDLLNGEAEELETIPCGRPGAAMSADARRVAYTRFRSCVESGEEYRGREPELFVRDLDSGEVVGPLMAGTRLEDVLLSPSGDRTWLRVREGDEPFRFMVSSGDGAWREIVEGQLLGGALRRPDEVRWLGDDRVLMLYRVRQGGSRWSGRTRTGIEIVDTDTGTRTKYLWQ